MDDLTYVSESLESTFLAVRAMGEAQRRFAEESDREIRRLWTDNAALRDELHAVANRLESLTRALTTHPSDVAAKIVNEANRATLREVREGECSICGGTGQAPGLHAACSICEGTGKRLT